MARKPATRVEFALFDVFYEDGSQRSNRRVPSDILGGLDGDTPVFQAGPFAVDEADRRLRDRNIGQARTKLQLTHGGFQEGWWRLTCVTCGEDIMPNRGAFGNGGDRESGIGNRELGEKTFQPKAVSS